MQTAVERPAAIRQPLPFQPAEMAVTGHSLSQSPQSTHLSASIWYFASPSLIASWGQTGAQVPHFVHESEIMYAMARSLVLRTDLPLLREKDRERYHVCHAQNKNNRSELGGREKPTTS
jgi:hypothetical protein